MPRDLRRIAFSSVLPIVLAGLILLLDILLRRDNMVSLSTLVGVTILSGVASMVIIEMFKRLLPLRGWYQERLVSEFFGLRREEDDLGLHAGGHVGSIYNLPTEQMIAQLASRTAPVLRSRVDFDDREFDDREDYLAYVERRQAQRMNELHVLIAGRWRHYVRATAAWLSGAIALVITSIHVSGVPDSRSIPITALIFGGFIAWFGRDVAASVERFRR